MEFFTIKIAEETELMSREARFDRRVPCEHSGMSKTIMLNFPSWLVKTTKMVVNCCAFGCANCFRALQGHFLKDFQHFQGYQEAINSASETPRLGPIKILQRICGDYFVSGK